MRIFLLVWEHCSSTVSCITMISHWLESAPAPPRNPAQGRAWTGHLPGPGSCVWEEAGVRLSLWLRPRTLRPASPLSAAAFSMRSCTHGYRGVTGVLPSPSPGCSWTRTAWVSWRAGRGSRAGSSAGSSAACWSRAARPALG